jgi:L-malate glycosyltransferase
MNLLHVIDGLMVGGAERVLVELANQAYRDGHEVAVCVTRSDTTLASDLLPGIDLWVLGRKGRFDFRAMKRFGGLVEQHRIDLIQAHSRSTLTFLGALITLRLVRTPVIFLDHFGKIDIDTAVPWWFRLGAKYWVSEYVGVCEALGLWARTAGLPAEKISVIENGLDLHHIMQAEPLDLRQELNISREALIGVVVAGVRYEKGIDVLIEAMSFCPKVHSAKILVVGGARDPEFDQSCRERVAALGLAENLMFLGERMDVPYLLRGADFAMMPSRSEACNLVFIEYLACALPFVSTLAGGIARQAEALGLPEFVPIDDPKSLAAALYRLLSLTSDERRERGEAGQAFALQHFDIRNKMRQWYRLYEQVLGAEKI